MRPYHNIENNKLWNLCRRLPFYTSLLGVLLCIYDFGFIQQQSTIPDIVYNLLIVIGFVALVTRYLSKTRRPNSKVLLFDGIMFLIFLIAMVVNFEILTLSSVLFTPRLWLFTAIFFSLVRETYSLELSLRNKIFNPARIFIGSFFIIIIIGSLLLLLPNATTEKIRYIDALFTSTSAVCVTGLAVVDTATYYTQFGQTIILLLIQVGGLGIMTFASYFSYFFKGSASYESQMLLSEMTNNEKLGEVFNTLKKIIIVTFMIEILGAVIIFYCLDSQIFPALNERIYISVFHSVSGFCNAGFSTLTNNLYENTLRFNYPLHLIVASLIIFGGIGFPIIFNLWKYIINKISNLFRRILHKERNIYVPWLLNINSRIIIATTIFLILFGTVMFLIFEYNNTLIEHNWYGKIVTAFFGSVTTRTAGFNTVDTAALALPTTLVFLFLMWVGASPASTGGGIKTSTLAVAFSNFICLAKGIKRVEIFGREVSQISVNRAFAVIILSILVILTSVFVITLYDADKGLLNILFECISAHSTVGLSRGITGFLSSQSKFVLIVTMFVGRVSMFTILIATFKQVRHLKYRYPTEDILIN